MRQDLWPVPRGRGTWDEKAPQSPSAAMPSRLRFGGPAPGRVPAVAPAPAEPLGDPRESKQKSQSPDLVISERSMPVQTEPSV